MIQKDELSFVRPYFQLCRVIETSELHISVTTGAAA